MHSIDLRGTIASVHLDMIRGLAALAVVYSHARVLLLRSATPGIPLSSRLLYLFSGYGHSAVTIFFVLSGFLVGSSVIRAIESGQWSWHKYLVARGVRIYVVLIPALLLTVVWDRIGLHMIEGIVQNQDTAVAIVTANEIAQHSGPITLIGNLFCLQTVLLPCYGSNTALWSLANEVWYYLAFPCLYQAIRGSEPLRVRVIYASLGVAMLLLLGSKISLLFPIWLLGALLVGLPIKQRNLTWWTNLLAALPLLVVLLFVGIGKLSEGYTSKYAVSLTFTLFLTQLLQHRDPSSLSFYSHAANALSSCSYSLYLTHLPLLILMRALWTYETPWAPDVKHWIFVMFACLACLIFAYAISKVTESRTEQCRRWLTGDGKVISRTM